MGVTYNFAEKKKALKVLMSCEFNFRKAARKVGVSERSLRTWNKEYGSKVFGKETDIELLTQKQAEMQMAESEPLRTRSESILEKVLEEIESRMINDPKKIKFTELLQAVREIGPHVMPKLVYNKEDDEEKNVLGISEHDKEIILSFANVIKNKLGDETVNQASLTINSKERSRRSK